MQSVLAPFPSFGFDCVTAMDSVRAPALKAAGMNFAVRYLGSVTASELAVILDAGLLFMPVTYADRFDGSTTVNELNTLGIPAGATVWLDVESVHEDAATVIANINAWADAVSAGGWQPGLYVGPVQPLTAEELYQLRVVRYWRSQSNVPAPACGFCLQQSYPSVVVAGTNIDVDTIQQDWQGRLPMMVST